MTLEIANPIYDVVFKYLMEDNRVAKPFRKYLGKQYMNSAFFRWIMEAGGREVKTGIPILPIYFLGEQLTGFEDVPVILVNRCVRDRHTQEIIAVGSHFIESLFHEGIIIHIPAIHSDRRRDELETLLSIFDQEKRQENHHIMNVKETDFPEKFRPIIRRLQAAAQEKEVRDTMTIEDDFIAELNDYEHRIAEAVRKQEEALREKAEERSLKEEALRKQEEERKQKEEERKQKEEERNQKEEAVRLLLSLGMPAGAIAQKLGLPLEVVAALEKGE